jgi:hypothetical protein
MAHGKQLEPSERDPFNEAMKQLARATTDRQRLRGLEAVRASLMLQLRDFRRHRASLKNPDKRQLGRLEHNVADAWMAYEASATGGLDTSLRALAGVREALAQLQAATARLEKPVEWVTLQIRLHENNGGGVVSEVQWPAWAVPLGGKIQLRWPTAVEVAALPVQQVPQPSGNGHPRREETRA